MLKTRSGTTSEHTGGLGDAPVEPQYIKQMRALAEVIDEVFNGKPQERQGERTTGFVLLVFPFFDHHGRCNYMSNAKREDVVTMLKEQLARFEGRALPDAKT
jgi:hypothetical protein